MSNANEDAGEAAESNPPTIPNVNNQPPPSSHGSKDHTTQIMTPYGVVANAANGKKSKAKNNNMKKQQSQMNVGDAKKFLKKDHHDSNMVVAVRIRPMNTRETNAKDFDVLNV